MGPRPLPLYLGIEGWMLTSSSAVSMLLRSGSPRWSPDLPDELRAQLGTADPTEFAEAFAAEGRRRYAAFLDGVAAYRGHPYRRRLVDPPAAWSAGALALRDYAPGSDGPPVLAVPSLINRGYILDLTGKRSLMRHLARRGLHPFLVDWGTPEEELSFTLTDYLERRLEPAAAEVLRCTGRRPAIIGYCMGGVLALALALRRPDLVSAYVALATPWNFQADDSPQMRILMAAGEAVADTIDRLGQMPVDLIQAMFSGLDPMSIGRKFRMFAALPPRAPKTTGFVALEDWLNDGVPLAAPVAREALLGWYGANSTARLEWRIGGQVMDPAALTVPTLCLIPALDRIVPPESARALAVALPPALTEVRMVPLGHIGMISGTQAVKQVYAPLVRWLKARAATQDTLDSGQVRS